jgi:hypothetical protein
VEANARAIADYLHLGAGDVAATTLPLSYCYGLSVINSHLSRGASVALTGLSVVDPCFWELVQSRGVTSLAGVPYTFDLLDRVGFEDMELPSLRLVTQAGGRLAPERVRAYSALGRRRGWDFYVMYGQTEATARMAYLPPDLAMAHPDSIGVPIPGGEFRLDPVPGMGAEELVYRGPNVMLGYAEQAEDLGLGRTVHELRTGDLARRNEAGLYEILGRRSRFVKIAGLRVDLGQAERHLAQLGTAAAVAGNDDRLVAAVENVTGPSLLGKELARAFALPRAAVVVHPVDQFPRLPNGKPDYQSILALAAEDDDPDDVSAGGREDGSSVEDVRRILAESLEVDDVAETDSFVSLGGDSLSYVAASVRLEQALGALPQGWHLMPAVELATSGAPQKVAAEDAEPARRRWRERAVAPLETGIALRGAGIVMVVCTHIGLFSWPGMAHILLAVAGYNFARFHLTGSRVRRLAGQLRTMARILVPSMAFIAFAWMVTDKRYTLANVFLLDTFLGPKGWEVHAHFWFIERLAYLLAGAAVLTAVPLTDRAQRRWPWAFPAALLAVGVVSRFLAADPGLPDGPVLWLFALGWAAAAARGTQRRVALTLAAAAAAAGYFQEPARDGTILAGLLLLIWFPRLPVPRALHNALGVLAGSSLYIYLTHWLVYPHLDQASKPLAVVASLAVGIAYCAAVTKAVRAVERLTRSLIAAQGADRRLGLSGRDRDGGSQQWLRRAVGRDPAKASEGSAGLRLYCRAHAANSSTGKCGLRRPRLARVVPRRTGFPPGGVQS